MKNKKPKTMSIHICTIYNNGSFAIKFTKLFLPHIFSILSNFVVVVVFYFILFYFFSFFTLFNFSPSSTIAFLVHSFISSYHCLNFLLYIFLNSTVSLCSTSLIYFHPSSSILIFI